MKRFSLLVLLSALLFFAGCGGSGNDYDKYDDGDTDQSGDSDNVKPDNDSDKDSDAGDSGTSDQDGETPDGNEPDSGESDDDPDDADSEQSQEDFWATCEGIIACTNGCIEDDSECRSDCYGKGTEEEQLYYRRWRECFDDKCAEDKTAECSAENCAEWDEICNVAEAWDYEVTFPAPYGSAEFEGSFSVILGNAFPVSEDEVAMSAFAQGSVASMQLASSGMMITFLRMLDDKRDGKVLEVFQTPLDTTSMKPLNPVTILRIKADAAVEGERTVGFDDDSDARFIVGEIDDHNDILCYHAFGKGSFAIDGAEIKIGSGGWISFNSGSVELFSPQNIPELGGDARETLGVEACSLIW